jgi:protein-tyrosine-phosphatase/predicted ATP-grasp superfamily ATP-dependent carboligase
MDSQRSTLILDGTPRVVVTVARSLNRKGIPVVFGRFGRWLQATNSKSIGKHFDLHVDHTGYYQELNAIIEQENIDTIMPGNDLAMRSLLPHYGALASRVMLTIPDPCAVTAVLDKSRTLDVARRCAVTVPQTFDIKSINDLTLKAATLRFPIVAKPSQAGVKYGLKAQYFNHISELVATFEEDPQFGLDTIFQTFVSGHSVGLSGLMHRGVFVAPFQHRRIQQWPASGGVAVLMESESVDIALLDKASDLLNAIKWEGPAMVEFRRDARTGEHFFLEVNGRFWGSLPLAWRCGLDFPYLQWQALHGMLGRKSFPYAAGVRVRWSGGAIRRLDKLWTDREERRLCGISRAAALGQFLVCFAPGVRSALFDLKDPRPELADVLSALRVAGRSIVRRLVPQSTRHRYRQWAQLQGRARRQYAVLWLIRALGFRSQRRANMLSSVNSVLFVCRGNRIRSPLGAAVLNSVLRQYDSHIKVASAGTHAVAGSEIDERTLEAAASFGIGATCEPQTISDELVRNSDLILVMDYVLEAEVIAQFPKYAGRVFLIRELGKRNDDLEILDPDKLAPSKFSANARAIHDATVEVARVLIDSPEHL